MKSYVYIILYNFALPFRFSKLKEKSDSSSSSAGYVRATNGGKGIRSGL